MFLDLSKYLNFQMNSSRSVNDAAYELHARVCKSLSSPVRLKVLDILRNGEKSVKALVSLTRVSQPNLSIHLKFLWESGVLERRQQGTMVYYRVAQPEIYDVIDIFRKINTKKLARDDRLTRKRIPR